MRAVILAGGRGRRLEPYTITFPKPLVPVGEMPILEIVIRQLSLAGFTEVTMAVGHLSELLMSYFQDGSKWNVDINYSKEEQPLGTVGPLKLIDDLPETFLVMNGDVLTTLSYEKLFNYHVDSGADLTIACHRCSTKIDLGIIEFDGRLMVTGYREKPTLNYDVSMGVYVFNKSVLDLLDTGQRFDFPDLVNAIIKTGGNVKVYLSDDLWLDIGRPEDYAHASEVFESMKTDFLPGEAKSPALTVESK